MAPPSYVLPDALGYEIGHRVRQQNRAEYDLDGYRDPMIAIVHDNQDPQKLGRVKVNILALTRKVDSEEQPYITDWVQLIVPGAGANRGWFFIPEVKDEVLVMFRDGEPLVVGALWNKEALPPDKNPDGDNPRRSIKSRAGSSVILDDGGDVIIIKDGAGKAQITFDAASNQITIEALEGDVCFQSPKGEMKLAAQSATFEAKKNIEIHSGGEMKWSSTATVELGQNKVELSGGTKSALSCGGAQPSPPDAPATSTKIDDPYGS